MLVGNKFDSQFTKEYSNTTIFVFESASELLAWVNLIRFTFINEKRKEETNKKQ